MRGDTAPAIATSPADVLAAHARGVRPSDPLHRLYRAIDQYGQVIDVLAAEKRNLAATRRFFTRALEHAPCPAEVTTDRAPAYPQVLDELMPAVWHVVEQYANNPIETDHGRVKSRLRPMRGLTWLRSAHVISASTRGCRAHWPTAPS